MKFWRLQDNARQQERNSGLTPWTQSQDIPSFVPHWSYRCLALPHRELMASRRVEHSIAREDATIFWGESWRSESTVLILNVWRLLFPNHFDLKIWHDWCRTWNESERMHGTWKSEASCQPLCSQWTWQGPRDWDFFLKRQAEEAAKPSSTSIWGLKKSASEPNMSRIESRFKVWSILKPQEMSILICRF